LEAEAQAEAGRGGRGVVLTVADVGGQGGWPVVVLVQVVLAGSASSYTWWSGGPVAVVLAVAEDNLVMSFTSSFFNRKYVHSVAVQLTVLLTMSQLFNIL
jgi:hypothetical protein